MSKSKQLLAILLVLAAICSMLTACSNGDALSDGLYTGDALTEEDFLYNSNGLSIRYIDTLDVEEYQAAVMYFDLACFGEEPVNLSVASVSINSYTYPFSSYHSLSTDSSDTLELTVDYAWMQACGVQTICNASFDIELYNEEQDVIDHQTLTVALGADRQEHDTSGTVLLDKDGLLVILKSIDFYDIGFRLNLYAHNSMGQPITLVLDELMLHGCCSSQYSALQVDLRDGERCVDAIPVEWGGDIGIHSLEDLKNLALSVKAYTTDNYTYLLEEAVFQNLGDAELTYASQGGQEIFNQDGLSILLRPMRDDLFVPYFCLEATVSDPTAHDLFLDITQINGKDTWASISVVVKDGALFLLYPALYYDEEAGFTSVEDIESITFLLSLSGNSTFEKTFTVAIE